MQLVIIIIAIVFMKKRKSKSSSTKFKNIEDMDSFLDDISSRNADINKDLLNEELKRNKIVGKKEGMGGTHID